MDTKVDNDDKYSFRYRSYDIRNMPDVTRGTGTAYPSRVYKFTSDLKWGCCYSIVSSLCSAL